MTPTRVLLELDLAQGLLDSPPADPIAAVRARNIPVLSSVIARLREAAASDAVVGLIAHVGPDVLTSAQVEELGAAVEALEAAGKRTVCWTEAFGETGNGTLSYYLGAHFQEVWLQPSGSVALVGAAAGATFLRGALDRLGVEPQIHARHEFKNAPDSLMRESMTSSQREALQRLTDSLTEQVVKTVARRRGLGEDVVRGAIADAPISPQAALELGLVDAVGYRDEAYAATAKALGVDLAVDDQGEGASGDEVTKRFVHKWTPPKREQARKTAKTKVRQLRSRGKGSVVAVIPVDGGIMLGRSGGSPISGPSTGSDSTCAALRLAADDEKVAAVVLRVVSPGGSYIASDAIHREVIRARESGTPVVASMGTVAASGGYFVSMAADEILALPGTITGSIGVFAGKVVTGQALQRIGVVQESVQTGEQSTMWSASRPFTEDQVRRLDGWLDEVYADFTQKAADGRGMPVEQLEPLARGRVWTGADALERGLVDRLGGLDEAITVAAEKAGRARADVTPRRFPHASPLARLRSPQHSDSPNA
ncbi:MAG: signal peptide peptidase SppA, partial [Solirubrobacteraceae bacterium]|nr:signal peptide peptidase SppA [Solirubrobacteraceae bacterium]